MDIAKAIKNNFNVNGRASANYNAITDVATADNVIKALEALIK